jgi:hypothetical protein
LFNTLLEQFNAALMATICGLAVWRGDRHARIVGVAVGFGWLISALAQDHAELFSPLYLVVFVDAGLLLLLGVVSYQSDKNWPVVATVLQALGLVAHASYAFEINLRPIYYYWALAISAYGVILALLVGTIGAWWERRALATRPAGVRSPAAAE